LELTEDELYKKMCAWDRENFIVGAGTKGLSDKNSTGGMVDNHAYSVLDCFPNVAGSKIDLLKVRNPWGKGEIEDGEFDDDGPGWDRYPKIKAELKPVVADDGIFYLTKSEFFKFFDHLYVSAASMTRFKED
jgi:Calpain family cysteine protease